jgi:addiction module toxin, relE/stbE family
MELNKNSFNLIISDNAEKELRKIPEPYFSKIIEAIEDLQENPRPHGYKKLKSSKIFHRIRVSDYRVIYSIDDNVLTVEIVRVKHRKDVYK